MTRRADRDQERLIGALIPPSVPRTPPIPVPLPALPRLRPPAEPNAPILHPSRLDRSGRLSARPVLSALGWRAGHRLDIAAVDDIIVITAASTGQHTVGTRGYLLLPAATRALAAIGSDQPVLLMAYPHLEIVRVNAVATVVRLLAPLGPFTIGDDHDG
jgi:bifunctional DNA-binding transcriptional regulator/antitoxin component of YhaV-PrlF toxin-antitoxin module